MDDGTFAAWHCMVRKREQAEIKCLENFEMWLWRRTLMIIWKESVTN